MKKILRVFLVSLAFLTASFGVSAPVSALSYTVTDLGTLSGDQSVALDINNRGQVVGFYQTNHTNAQAFLYSSGSIVDLAPFGFSYSVAETINDRGQVVGTLTSNQMDRAFLYDGKTVTDLGTLGGIYSYGEGSNERGQIVGGSTTSGNDPSSLNTSLTAYLYSDGKMKNLGTLGGTTSNASDINNKGQIVGWAKTTEDNFNAFLYSDGKMTNIGTLGGSLGDNASFARAINDNGQVVGTLGNVGTAAGSFAFLYSKGTMTILGTLEAFAGDGQDINNQGQVVGILSGGLNTGFLYSDGTMFDLNNLIVPNSGWTISGATGINDRGQIVGLGIGSDGKNHALVMTPLPEPEIYAMMAIGIGVLGFVRCKRKCPFENRATRSHSGFR